MEEMESMDVRRVKKSCPCKRRDMGCCCSSLTLELEQEVKEIWNWTKQSVINFNSFVFLQAAWMRAFLHAPYFSVTEEAGLGEVVCIEQIPVADQVHMSQQPNDKWQNILLNCQDEIHMDTSDTQESSMSFLNPSQQMPFEETIVEVNQPLIIFLYFSIFIYGEMNGTQIYNHF